MARNATGKAIANLEMRFLDPRGEDVGPNGPGEITIRGPNIMMYVPPFALGLLGRSSGLWIVRLITLQGLPP